MSGYSRPREERAWKTPSLVNSSAHLILRRRIIPSNWLAHVKSPRAISVDGEFGWSDFDGKKKVLLIWWLAKRVVHRESRVMDPRVYSSEPRGHSRTGRCRGVYSTASPQFYFHRSWELGFAGRPGFFISPVSYSPSIHKHTAYRYRPFHITSSTWPHKPCNFLRPRRKKENKLVHRNQLHFWGGEKKTQTSSSKIYQLESLGYIFL